MLIIRKMLIYGPSNRSVPPFNHCQTCTDTGETLVIYLYFYIIVHQQKTFIIG